MSKPTYVMDTEIYKDYFLVCFRDIEKHTYKSFEQYHGHKLNADGVRKIIQSALIVTFNGNNFDIPVLSLALAGADCAKIKQASDAIIVNNMRGWQIEKQFNFKSIKQCDHIDLIEVAPGMVSLKIYGGRLHCQKMQDLPIDPSASISEAQRVELRQYCRNDLEITEMLYRKLLPQITLRGQMSEQYGQDLRSKSDAQIAEAVIKAKVGEIVGIEPERPKIEAGTLCYYKAPEYIHFKSEQLNDILRRITTDPFTVIDSGKTVEPEWLVNLKIPIGNSVYRMGIGGLHSTESCAAHVADDDTILIDRDVASYYPSIILGSELAPKHLGKPFLDIYRQIVQRRLEAKHGGNTVEADALKITINGSFGKFGSKWSALYSPDLLIQTTVTGQLALLMLIEQLEAEGISVVSANTDGVVIKCPIVLMDRLDDVIAGWEIITGFDTEETQYSALYSRDVNNYIAIKTDGKVKVKGVFATNSLSKNPTNAICVEAVIAFLRDGTPVEDTIKSCVDVTKFVTVRSVKGGALDQLGGYLGKAIRWYYAKDLEGTITYKVNGYNVARTEGAMPLMEIPALLPTDIDYGWYITEANSILAGIGHK